MKRLCFKKQVDPHLESLERRIKANEEYLETMVAGTEEYEKIQKSLSMDYEERRKMTESKIKVGDVVAVAGVVMSALGIIANVVTSERSNNTKKELCELAYKKEELDNELKNGTVMNIAMK